MGKSTAGTTASGRMHKKKIHKRCPRCGRRAFNIRKKFCAACGFGRDARIRNYSWARKTLTRSMRVV